MENLLNIIKKLLVEKAREILFFLVVFFFGLSFSRTLIFFIKNSIKIEQKGHDLGVNLDRRTVKADGKRNISPESFNFLWEKGILGRKIVVEQKPKEEEVIKEVVVSPLSDSYKLVGTIIGGKKENYAFIYHTQSNTTFMKKQGEEIEPGAKIVSIKPDRVEILRGNRKEILFLFEEDKKKFEEEMQRAQMQQEKVDNVGEKPFGIPPGQIFEFESGGGPLSSQLRRVGADTFEVKREFIVSNLSDMTQLLISARAIPYIKDGKIQGFRLVNISPSSFYRVIGIQDGDVIKSINKVPVSSPEAILKIFSDIQNETYFEIVLERNGVEKTFKYYVR
jgi:type II secretion system protein C